MLDITRLLTDKTFRKEVMTHVTTQWSNNFWKVEFATWNDKFAAEAVAPVLNKVGAFTANPLVRNIIGQPKTSFNVRTNHGRAQDLDSQPQPRFGRRG